MKQKIASIATGCILAFGLLIGYWYIRADNSFDVVYSAATQIPGYEPSHESVRVYASSEIKASQIPAVFVVGGWLLLVLMIAGIVWVATDAYLGNSKTNETKSVEWRAWVAVVVPWVLCTVFWFGPYAASLDQGSLVVTMEELQSKYGVSDATAEQIRKDSGKNIQDESGLLTKYFTGK